MPLSKAVHSEVSGVTVSNGTGFILRQKGAYVAGTNSSTRKKASSFNQSIQAGWINVVVTMPSGAGFTTNELIAIDVNMKVSFW